MNKEVIVLNCKKCGEDFLYEYRGSGRKPDFCEDCRKKINNQMQKEYKQKQATAKKAMATKAMAKEVDDFTDSKYADFVQRITQSLNILDSLRVKMCELSKEMNEYQSSFDKNDQTYLHKLENIDTDNIEETQKMIKEWKASRNGRRNVKDLIAILGNTIDAIPYKSYAKALPVLKGSAYVKR